MKLEKLKSAFKSKYLIRVIAGILTVAVVGSASAASQAYEAKSVMPKEGMAGVRQGELDGGPALEEGMQSAIGRDEDRDTSLTAIGKEETVYIIADAVGKPQKTIVSEWLKNPQGKDILEDVSDLTDIENVKGDETFEQKGNALSWNANGKDIYYQGKTTKQAPVTEKISFFLDGKKISAEDIAGKSGKVAIRFDYTNHEKKGNIYVPFTVASGMLLDDSFTNVEVTNGKVVSNGDKNMVFGIAMPGLKESLRVNENDFSGGFSIPEYVEITADVKEFELDMTMTVVMGGSEFIGGRSIDLTEIDGKIEDLTDAMAKLEDGSGELSEGLLTLDGKMGEFSDGVNSLQGGILAYTDGAKTLADGIGALKGQSTTLISGVADLAASVRTLTDGVITLDEALNTPMGKKEKEAACEKAQSAAQAVVDAQFADNANPQGYNQIKAQAETQFTGALTSDASLAAVKQQAADAASAQAGQIAAQASQAAAAQMQQDGEIQAQMNNLRAAITAAGQMQYAQSDAGRAAIAEQAAGMAGQLMEAGFSPEQVAALQDILVAAASANVMANDGNGQAAGQAAAEAAIAGIQQSVTGGAGQAAANAVKEAAPQLAEATVRGVAEQAKGSIGTAMAESVKAAAKTAAGQAAGQAAIEGAEQAKKAAAQSIEKKDSKSGYSLVSGMEALDGAVQGMSGKIPLLTEGIDKLYTGSQALASKNEELNSGATRLLAGKDQLAEGVKRLSGGSKELADGIVEFDEEGIQKMADSYNGDVKGLADRIQAVVDAGNGYESFGGKAGCMAGNVKFIIKTGAVKAE